jgi:hypothetical protein
VQKADRNSTSKVVIIVTELDLPVLEATVPSIYQSRRVNLNEEIPFTMIYSGNPDKVFYSGALIYQ